MSDEEVGEESSESLFERPRARARARPAAHRRARKRKLAHLVREREMREERELDELADSVLDEEERKLPRKRANTRASAPPPPKRHPTRFTVDEYDADARMAEFIQANGHPPYCFLCSWVGGMDEAQQTAYNGLIKAYVDNCTQVDRVELAGYIEARYYDVFFDLVLAHEKEKLARAKEDEKMQKLNRGLAWTEEDEAKYAWTEASAEKYRWPKCSILYHFDNYPTEEQAYKEAAFWAHKVMKTIVRGGLVQVDEKTNKKVIDRAENVNLAVAYKIYRDASKNAQTKAKRS